MWAADAVGGEKRAGVRGCDLGGAETLAWMGLSSVSWSSSVMLKSVSRTGNTRCAPNTSTISGAVGGMTSMTPANNSTSLAMTRALFG